MQYMMNLKDLAKTLEEKDLLVSVSNPELQVCAIGYDSRNITEGQLFICKGLKFKEEYLLDAKNKGASCYMSEIDYNNDMPCIIVKDVRKALAITAAYFYGYPAKKLHITGITGTTGKTSTAYMMQSIANAAAKKKTGVFTTEETFDGRETIAASLTTPESLSLHTMFATMVEEDVPYCSMEVTSQAYKVDRVYGITFDVGIFLNIGEDHISPIEHDTFEDYLKHKLMLFENCKTAIIDSSCTALEKCIEVAKANCDKVIVVGSADYDLWYQDVQKEKRGYSFTVVSKDGTESRFSIANEGKFNIDNALTVIAAARDYGISDDDIREGLKDVYIPGRVNIYDFNGAKVIVDYAHNKLGYNGLFKWITDEYSDKTIKVVGGSAGSRNILRREQIAGDWSEYADYVYITEEDPEYEPPIETCEALASMIKGDRCKYEIVVDRKEAIEKAMTESTDNDVIIITGKGNERFRKFQGRRDPYPSDVDIVVGMIEK